jgi:hypothetical protein
MLKLPKFLQYKWALADAIIVIDVFQNAINETSYDAIAGFFGIEPSLINSLTSLLELGRFFILAHHARKPTGL